MVDPDQSGNPVSEPVYQGPTLGWKLIYETTEPPFGIANVLSFVTASITSFPAEITTVQTQGYYAQGDGGGGVYNVVGAGPAALNKFQSADGRWWQLVTTGLTLNPRQLGAKGDGATNDAPSFQKAWDLGGASYSTLRVTPGHYAFSTALSIVGACFYRTFLCDPGAVFIPLANSQTIIQIDATLGTFAFNHFEGASFENPGAKTLCNGIRLTSTDATKVFNNNKFVNLDFHNYENGILLDRTIAANNTNFDWNTFTNISYLDCNYGFRSLCGSGTGNVYAVGTIECNTDGLAWFGGAGAGNIGDITITGMQVGNATNFVYLDSAGGYRSNISITACQADAGVTNFINAVNYTSIHMKGNSWGGTVVSVITGGSLLDIDGKDASQTSFGSNHNPIASTTIDPICTVQLPAVYTGVVVEVVSEGLVQGRGQSVTKSLVLITASGAGALATAVTKLASLFAASGEILHTATIVGTTATINATYTATGANSILRHNVVARGTTFDIARL